MEEQQNQQEQQSQQNQQSTGAAEPKTATKEDIDKNKAMGILAYIIFFIPLLAAKDSKFAMYHANQGLILFLASIIIWIVSGIIPFIGWFIIGPLGSLAVLIFAIMGIINAAKGEMKPLPLIGGIEIIK